MRSRHCYLRPLSEYLAPEPPREPDFVEFRVAEGFSVGPDTPIDSIEGYLMFGERWPSVRASWQRRMHEDFGCVTVVAINRDAGALKWGKR